MQIHFDGKGPLASALRKNGRTPSARVTQQAYADHLVMCLERHEPAFMDAETGVGKTLGYLTPMLEKMVAEPTTDSRPILVVSTATVALQKQITEGDLPVALEAVYQATGASLTAAFRVGKRQVVDSASLLESAEELASGDELILADEMAEWCRGRVEDGFLPLRADLVAAFADRIKTVPPWLLSDFSGLNPEHPDADAATVVLYRERLEACDNADVLVVNHHLLALHMLRPFLWSEERRAYIVVDEADRLPSVVEDINKSHVPLFRLQRLAESIPVGMKDVLAAVQQISELISPHWEMAWEGRGGAVVPLSRLHLDDRQELLAGIGDLRAALDATVRGQKVRTVRVPAVDRDQIASLERYCIDLDRIVRLAEAGDLSRAVLYYSPVRRYPGIASINQGAGRLIAKKLWDEPDNPVAGLLFTSATLSTLAHGAATVPKRALAAFIKACGFKSERIAPDTCAVIAPTRFGDMQFVRPALDAPSAFTISDEAGEEGRVLSDAALDYWRRMIEAAHGRGGRTLVLVPALRDVTALAGQLEACEGCLVAQTPGYQTDAAVARFMARDDSIWVSASAWEGVSLVNAISHIVIPRIPIRPATFEDTVVQRYLAEITGSDRAGRSVVFGRQMAEARRRLRQGIGRGIRSHDDRVTIWIGDPRWPLSQKEADEMLMDQPRAWSPTMANAIPTRFRRKLDQSPRFYDGYV